MKCDRCDEKMYPNTQGWYCPKCEFVLKYVEKTKHENPNKPRDEANEMDNKER